MMPLDLFDGMAIDYGEPVVSMKRARRLVERVEELAGEIDGLVDAGLAVEREAKALGAHSVARAVFWLLLPETLSRHGYDAMHARAERIARNWLKRMEVTR